jgi:FkbM family methyltransferase
MNNGALLRLLHRANAVLRKGGWQLTHRQPGIVDFIRQKAITTVLDVGANDGQYGSGLRLRGYAGKIVSFEPIPATFKRLQRRVAGDSLWRLRDAAVGAHDGTATINISEYDVFSSLMPPTERLIEFDRRAMALESIEIPVTRIDTIFHEFKGERVFLKSDTQGYEKNVIQGAAASLKDIVGVQLEIGLVEFYEGQLPFVETIQMMAGHGFVPALILPNNFHEKDPVRLLEVDVVFLNERAIS